MGEESFRSHYLASTEVVGKANFHTNGPVNIGTRCRWNERSVQVVNLQANGIASVFDEGAGQVLDIPIDQLTSLHALPRPMRDEVPHNAEDWARAVALCVELRRFAGAIRLPRTEATRLARQFSLTVRTILRLRRRYMEDPRASALLPRSKGRKAGSKSLDYRVEKLISHVIRKYFLRRELITVAELIERICSLCRRLNLPSPNPKTIRARVASQDEHGVARSRFGAKRADQKYVARTGALSSDRPLALCQIDHTLVDLLIVSKDRRQVLGRPWITVACCVATRSVLGIYLTMDAPSAESVALCIEHATMPKVSENKTLPGRWPMCGKVEEILVDNGKDFRSRALQHGCDEHGIKLRWRPVATPHYGGHIERLMGTLMGLVKGLPGATFSNANERGDYEAESRAALTLEEARAWLVTTICDYYHARTHRGLGIPPVVAWERYWTDESGMLMAPPLVRDPHRFRLDFLPFETRRVQRTGVEFKCSRYWHPALNQWVGKAVDVVVRYHPHDLSTVWIHTPTGDTVEALPIAGRVLSGQPRALDAAEKGRLEQRLDVRFSEVDAIVETAIRESRTVKRTAKENRPLPGRGGRKGARRNVAVETKQHRLPAPNRKLVTSEEID